jgi:hypothetical protein
MANVATAMRAAGVHRIAIGPGDVLTEIELEPAHPDTIPAPGFDLGDIAPPAEEKPAGQCSLGACQEQAGFHFAPHLCERHGLQQLGVKT